MSPETARFVLLAVALGGLTGWLLALWGFARVAQPGSGEVEETDDAGRRRLIATRTSVVQADPELLAEGLLRSLASSGAGWSAQPVMVKRADHDRLVLESMMPPRLTAVPAFSRCEATLRPAGSGSAEITFRADYSAVRRKAMIIAGALLAAGLAFGAGLFVFLWLKVLPSGDKAVRGQVVQMMQMIHLLWPPWLVYSLYRRSRRATEMYLAAAAANGAAMAEALATARRKASEKA